MKNLIALAIICISSYCANAQTNTSSEWVNGYYKPSTGTWVDGYNKTSTNNTNWDNYSTTGNTNPYTTESGSRARDYSSEAWNYGQNQTIYTGSRGGQYYYNSNGNKVYVPKR